MLYLSKVSIGIQGSSTLVTLEHRILPSAKFLDRIIMTGIGRFLHIDGWKLVRLFIRDHGEEEIW